MEHTLYFRHYPGQTPQLLFTAPNAPTATVEQLLLIELSAGLGETGLYRAELRKQQGQTHAHVERLGEVDALLGMAHVHRSADGKLEIAHAQYDSPTSPPTAAQQQVLASAIAHQAKHLPVETWSWLLVTASAQERMAMPPAQK